MTYFQQRAKMNDIVSV